MFTPPEGEGRNSLHMFQAALKKLRSFSASALRAMAYLLNAGKKGKRVLSARRSPTLADYSAGGECVCSFLL